MLAELLEQDHRQQARTGKAARRDMERRRRLGDRLAPPAGEPLPNGLDHLPLTGTTSSVSVTSSPSFDSPHSGHLFVFRGRRGDLIKCLWHDGQGLCLFAKRLERVAFCGRRRPMER